MCEAINCEPDGRGTRIPLFTQPPAAQPQSEPTEAQIEAAGNELCARSALLKEQRYDTLAYYVLRAPLAVKE